MRNLLPLKIATLTALAIVLVLSFGVVEPLADWRQGELVVILPQADSVDQPFNQHLAQLFAAHLGVKLKSLELYPHQVPQALAKGTIDATATWQPRKRAAYAGCRETTKALRRWIAMASRCRRCFVWVVEP